MRRSEAMQLAKVLTNKQIKEMLDVAKVSIRDWSKVSNVNKSFSKGAAWNILAADFNENKKYHVLAKRSIIREYGEYLPKELRLKKEEKPVIKVHHQEPKL